MEENLQSKGRGIKLYLIISNTKEMKKIIFILFISSNLLAQVGINTTAPTRVLDVNGNMRLRNSTDKSSDVLYDRVLVSDSNGNIDYVQKKTLNQLVSQLFNITSLPATNAGGTGTTPAVISTQSINLSKPAVVTVTFSVPISIPNPPIDGRLRILRTHLAVNGTEVVRASETYTNRPTTTGTNLQGIFYNTGTYTVSLAAGTHTIELRGTCFDFAAADCVQGDALPATVFQAFAYYNEY